MAVTYSQLKSEINLIIPSGVSDEYILKWTNRTVNDIAMIVNIREHLVTAGSDLTYTTSDYSKAVPTNFLKISKRFTVARTDDTIVPIIGLDELAEYDPDHDETTTNTNPDYCAIEGDNVYVYPMFAGTLTLESYYRKPTEMTGAASNPDIPFADKFQDLIIAGTCMRLSRFKQDFDLYSLFLADWNKYLTMYETHLKVNNSKRTIETKYY